MEGLFLSILNMSITASFVIGAVMLARFCLKKAPKGLSYALWAVAGFRLVFPFSIESLFSLIPFRPSPIPSDIATAPMPRIDSGIGIVDNAVSRVLPAATPAASVNPMQVLLTAGTWLWLAGIAVMLIYSILSVVLLKRRLKGAVPAGDHIYEADNLKTPFVLGMFRPKIYLPTGLPEEERSYILLHERIHIRRHDHAVKILAYLILCLHWFNPFVWAAFLLMGADMEMSCDERVLKETGGEAKKAYSMSLLSLAAKRRVIGAGPLAFGEGGVKERIKNVLNFKRPSRVIIIVSVALVAVLSVGFAVNRTDVAKDTLLKAADVEKIGIGMPVDDVHRILGEPAGQLFGFWGDIYEMEGGRKAVIYYDPAGLVEQVKLMADENSYGNPDGRQMTLDDVRNLAKKGDGLTFEDFEPFSCINASSTYDEYVMVYGVEGGYRLILRTDGGGIDEVRLESVLGSGGIDIRYNDVDAFVNSGIIAVSGKNQVPVTVYPSPLDRSLSDIRDSLSYLDIDPDDEYAPFRVFADGHEQFGLYRLYDAQTLESIDFPVPSGLSSQAYILTDAEYGRSYIVTLAVGEWDEKGTDIIGDTLIFGIHMPSPAQADGLELIGSADVNRDGAEESIYLDKSRMDFDLYVTLRVCDAGGREIWNQQLATAHAGWSMLFLCEQNAEFYLLRYNPTMYHGYCTYSYTLFTLEGGREKVFRTNSLEFDINGNASLDATKMVAFADEINSLLEKSTLLVSTDGGAYSFGPSPAGPFYERFSWLDGFPELPGLFNAGDDLKTRLDKFSEYALSNRR